MSRQGGTRLAWSLWAVAIAMLVAGLYLSAAGDGPLDDIIATIVVVPVTASVGALIFARVPRNPIGWTFLEAGVLAGMQSLAAGYADYSLPSSTGGSLGEGVVAESIQPAHASLWLRAPETGR